jgi:hypothetical protein
MTTILFDSTATRKPARRTARPTRLEPSDEDKAAAAAMFADDADWDARMAADANGDECEACGRPVERGELVGGLCNVCQCRAEEATMASQYAAAGMGWRSY